MTLYFITETQKNLNITQILRIKHLFFLWNQASFIVGRDTKVYFRIFATIQ